MGKISRRLKEELKMTGQFFLIFVIVYGIPALILYSIIPPASNTTTINNTTTTANENCFIPAAVSTIIASAIIILFSLFVAKAVDG